MKLGRKLKINEFAYFRYKVIFTYKSMEENETDRFKARLVLRGFAQKDYAEIHSGGARMTTIIRALLNVRITFIIFFSN